MRRTVTVGAIALSLTLAFALWEGRTLRNSARQEPHFPARTPKPPDRLSEGCAETKELKSLIARSPESTNFKTAPLDNDAGLVYQAVIDGWLSHNRGQLNVSNTTVPLDASFRSGLADCACLEGIHLADSAPFHSRHVLTSALLRGTDIRLVNANAQVSLSRSNDPHAGMAKGKSVGRAVEDAFENGLFSLSEIAFDGDHHYAIVTYSFWCGSLCGSGATLVFEKVGNEWKRTNRACGGWVS